MKHIAATFLTALTALATAALARADEPAASAGDSNLVVHEWGVFSVFNDANYANADLAQEWADMPERFYRQFPADKKKLPYYGPVRKPILYFYDEGPERAIRVNVKFTVGAPVIWWPCSIKPGYTGRGDPEVQTEIEWSVWLGTKPTFNAGKPGDLLDVPADSWVAKARIPGPTTLCVPVSATNRLVRGTGAGAETERFLYYDGLTARLDYLRVVDATDKAVTVQSSAKFAIGRVLLMDRRPRQAKEAVEPPVVRYAWLDALPAGGKAAVDWRTASAKDFPALAGKALMGELCRAGLYANEANSVLAIWGDGLFDRPGITALYLLPRAEYDRMLPLTVKPAPTKTVRVGIVLHGCLNAADPATGRLAAKLIAELDSDSYDTREAAANELAKIAPGIVPQLRAALAKAGSIEVRTRLKAILDAVDAGGWLDTAKGQSP